MDRVLDCEGSTRAPQAPPFLAAQPVLAKNMYEILAGISTFAWEGSPASKVAEAPSVETAWQKELAHWEGIIDAQELSPQPLMRADPVISSSTHHPANREVWAEVHHSERTIW